MAKATPAERASRRCGRKASSLIKLRLWALSSLTTPLNQGPENGMSICGSSKSATCAPADFEACTTLFEMVRLYLLIWGDRPARELAWWGDQTLSIDQAIMRAMFMLERDGKRDGSHQRPFSELQLSAMGKRLVTHAPALERARGSFETLSKAVEHGLGLPQGRSPLLVYDVSFRLGCYLGTPPQHVYLHAGPREGAERLKPGLGRRRRLDPADPSQLPTSLRRRLSADQIENFLCVARHALHSGLWD